MMEYFKFTFVRNPFTRIASAYFHETRKTQHMSFEHFLKNANAYDLWFLNQSYYTHQIDSNDKEMTFIGRYENFKEDTDYVFNKLNIKEDIGFIAQEVEEVFPQVVLTADDERGTKSVDYGRLTGALIEAVKELSAKVKELEGRLNGSS